jgi:hypothetical protein
LRYKPKRKVHEKPLEPQTQTLPFQETDASNKLTYSHILEKGVSTVSSTDEQKDNLTIERLDAVMQEDTASQQSNNFADNFHEDNLLEFETKQKSLGHSEQPLLLLTEKITNPNEPSNSEKSDVESSKRNSSSKKSLASGINVSVVFLYYPNTVSYLNNCLEISCAK